MTDDVSRTSYIIFTYTNRISISKSQWNKRDVVNRGVSQESLIIRLVSQQNFSVYIKREMVGEEVEGIEKEEAGRSTV